MRTYFKVLKEAGLEEALLGISLSFNSDPEQMLRVAEKLAHKDGGHNKFLESICVWIDIRLPFKMWKQFDTYRIGVSKQSESTMHTILKRDLVQEDFNNGTLPSWLDYLNGLRAKKDFNRLTDELPDSFLQRRIVCTNYKTLRNIYQQRKNHKLREWKKLCIYLLKEVEHPEFIVDTNKKMEIK